MCVIALPWLGVLLLCAPVLAQDTGTTPIEPPDPSQYRLEEIAAGRSISAMLVTAQVASM